MADKRFQSLPGFRDFTPRDCAVRNYLFSVWRDVAHRYGFTEYDAPIVESTDLYLKKTGGELSSQLFRFEDQGGRDITLRPELTASLARIVGANQRDFPKPLKWFEIGPCFRYEKPQKGRGREFIQFNADILGEGSASADAELIALAIDTMLGLGFQEGDFVIRASDRESWLGFCADHDISDPSEFLPLIDRLEKLKPEALNQQLKQFGVTLEQINGFINNTDNASSAFEEIKENLEARGLGQFLELDLTIVRGLAYYTGAVFEIFDMKKSMRAVAGGGRYDGLLSTLSDGAADLPATGFAMGDMVIRNFIEETPNAKLEMEAWMARNPACDVYVVVADPSKRNDALGVITELRSAGISVDFAMTQINVGKQFKKAEQSGARFALVVGSEFPEMQLKVLASRTEETIHPNSNLQEVIQKNLDSPD
ncbi:MAG: histidine--tRNA ligase, partial [Verrucomicrobiae bacterium]|nr:histidine--tRNA ligase [Verrucomicrobiae bacterium]NNJ85720.1 histidine--tRNA ligase [Akkermansiaceae bacterium]